MHRSVAYACSNMKAFIVNENLFKPFLNKYSGTSSQLRNYLYLLLFLIYNNCCNSSCAAEPSLGTCVLCVMHCCDLKTNDFTLRLKAEAVVYVGGSSNCAFMFIQSQITTTKKQLYLQRKSTQSFSSQYVLCASNRLKDCIMINIVCVQYELSNN